MPDEDVCPICKTRCFRKIVADEHSLQHDDAVYDYLCDQCGPYTITKQDKESFLDPGFEGAYQLSAMIQERHLLQLPRSYLEFRTGRYPCATGKYPAFPPRVGVQVDALLSQWPATVPERLDRCLCNLSRKLRTLAEEYSLQTQGVALVFAQDLGEAHGHLALLKELGFIVLRKESRDHPMMVRLTARGWYRVTELSQRQRDRASPAFVAMWFGSDEDGTRSTMDEVYNEAIAPAVAEAGYHVTRVDRVEYNDAIMDRVLGDIRKAPFVIADCTGQRNGVYYEAGFARGLGTSVIYCCREDDFKNVHFDTKQLNFIVWPDISNLRYRLAQRIRGSLGEGPFAD